MKILSWNIRHGGKKAAIDNIVESIINHNADINLFIEYRENESGNIIKEQLKNHGWIHQCSSGPPPRQNGLLVISKKKITTSKKKYRRPKALHRWIDIHIPGEDLSLIGVHVPNHGEKWDKENYWKSIISFAKKNSLEKYIIIGDFNTGLAIDSEGVPFKSSHNMQSLLDMDWTDAWRHFYKSTREYTWYSNANNGFRLDHAFLSPAVAHRIVNAYFSHTERLKGYSDHSAIIVELGTME